MKVWAWSEFAAVSMAPAKSEIDVGGTSKAWCGAKNSVNGGSLAVITGNPAAIASNTTNPHPSLTEGKQNTSAL